MASARELRAEADRLDEIEGLEVAARAAKDVYRAATDDPELKAAHRAAGQALADARSAHRQARGPLVARVAVVPETVSATAGLEG